MSLDIASLLANYDILLAGLGIGILADFVLSTIAKLAVLLAIIGIIFGVGAITNILGIIWSFIYPIVHLTGLV